jgi:hypothetical protein
MARYIDRKTESFRKSSSPQPILSNRGAIIESHSRLTNSPLSLKPGSYLSHGTAAYLHNLADRELDTIYVNKEQSFKDSGGLLTQVGIKRAFSNKQRQSGYIITHNRTKITLLNGKHTDRLGVIRMTGSSGEQLELTDHERALIDIALRPAYRHMIRLASLSPPPNSLVVLFFLVFLLLSAPVIPRISRFQGLYLQPLASPLSHAGFACDTLGQALFSFFRSCLNSRRKTVPRLDFIRHPSRPPGA